MIWVGQISEFDMKQAGITVLYACGKISKELYEELLKSSKKNRVVKTGLLIRDHPEFYDIQTREFKKYIEKLMIENKIKKSHVLETVRDGIWLVNEAPRKLKFGLIQFVKKGNYTSVFKLKRRNIYIYYDSINDKIMCRGFKNTENEKLLKFVGYMMRLYETSEEDLLYEELHKKLNYYKENTEINLIPNISNEYLLKMMIDDFIK